MPNTAHDIIDCVGDTSFRGFFSGINVQCTQHITHMSIAINANQGKVTPVHHWRSHPGK